MKKSSYFAVAAAALLLISGCAQESRRAESSTPVAAQSASAESEASVAVQEPKADVLPRVIALKGPTAMGMVKMISDFEQSGGTERGGSFRIEAAPDAVVPAVTKGEADIFAVPSNLASVLYNKTQGQVQVLAINTLGVLHVVERGDRIRTLADLEGKTIVMSGQGAMPEYALNYLLAQSGVDASAVKVEWKNEHSEVLFTLAADSSKELIGILPQPFVTVAQGKLDDLRDAIDLNDTWSALDGGQDSSALITGVVIVRKAFAEEHPEAVRAFLDQYRASVDYTNTHIDEAAELIGKYDIVPAPIAKKAIPESHITFVEGAEMKSMLHGFYEVLFKQNPKSVGGKLPADDFYFGN